LGRGIFGQSLIFVQQPAVKTNKDKKIAGFIFVG